MGSSYYASLYAKYLLQEVARTDIEVGLSSEFVHYPLSVRNGQVFFLVSQSGESIETVKVAKFLRQKHARIIAVTNQPDSSLAAAGDMTILMHAGEELASATKTFTCTLAVFHRLAFATAIRKGLISPALLGKSNGGLISCANSMEREMPYMEATIKRHVNQTRTYRSAAVLARGFNLAPALQSALLFKEVVKVPAEGMTAGEFMHGPIEMASPELLAIILTGGRTSSLMDKLVGRLKKIHAETLAIGPQARRASKNILLKEKDETLLPFPSTVSLNLIVYFAALRRRLDPDRFDRISKITLVE